MSQTQPTNERHETMTITRFVDRISDAAAGKGITNTATGERFVIKESTPTGTTKREIRSGAAFGCRSVTMHEVTMTLESA